MKNRKMQWLRTIGMATGCVVMGVVAAQNVYADDIATFNTTIVEEGSCGDGLTYTIDSEGLLVIEGQGAVDSFAFGFQTTKENVKSIKVSEGVTTIESWAFSPCSNVESVTLPDSLTGIGQMAFTGCHKLTTIEIPKGVQELDANAFLACGGLESITVATENLWYKDIDGVVYTMDGKVLMCYPAGSDVTEFKIPEGVETMDVSVFHMATFTQIEIPASASDSVAAALISCDTLQSIEVAEGNAYYKDIDGVLYSKDGTKVINYPKSRAAEEYVIAEGVIEIGDDSFSGSNVTSVKIPSGVTTIGSAAFLMCTDLKSVEIPKSLEIMYWAAFYESGLEKVYYGGSEADWKKIQMDVQVPETFYNCTIYYNSQMSNTPNGDDVASDKTDKENVEKETAEQTTVDNVATDTEVNENPDTGDVHRRLVYIILMICTIVMICVQRNSVGE